MATRSAGNSSAKRARSEDGVALSAPVQGRALPISSGNGIHRPLKAAEAFARDLVRRIVQDGLKTGDKLPSETAMLEEYGLSRESLREALRLLEVQGLITLRRGPGGGPVVGHLDPANLGRTSTLFYHLAGGTYAELLDAWMVTEAMLAERAARNPDREAVREVLLPFVKDEDGSADADEEVAEFVQEHTHFHGRLASLAQNRVLEVMFQTPGQIVTHHVLGHADPRADRDMIIDEHREIARAVMAGAPQKAHKAMTAHIESMIEVHRQHLGARLDDFIDWR